MIPAAKPMLGDDEREAVDRVLSSGMIAQGPEVAAFETEFGSLVGDRECIAVSSGTSALHLGLVAAGIGPGAEVIVPSFTFAATANAVRLAGADPVFVDIVPESFCICPDAVESAITPRTAAIMPVHLYGQPAAMGRICDIASRHGLLVFEDAAQAHGASLGETPVACFGTVAAFSFYPTKNMTTGEGGMVVTNDPAIAHQVRLLRNQGMQKRYLNEIVGYNARMTDLAAAIGRVQLRRLADWTTRRRANAKTLDLELADLPGLETPRVAQDAEHVYHQYTIRVDGGRERRNDLQQRLAARGVGSGVYYPTPTHALPSFGLELDLPHTSRACEQVLSLPVHPGLGAEDLETIVTATRWAVSA